MLEWMHDPDIAKNFRVDFMGVTLEQAESFIEKSFSPENQHFAIVDEKDEYLGTISLKQIDHAVKEAEYAISTRKCAHGKGYARDATEELIKYAFETLGLHRVYLNVLKDNEGANLFYRKCGFSFTGQDAEGLFLNGTKHILNLYEIRKS